MAVWLLRDLVDAVEYFTQDYRRLQQVALAIFIGVPLLLIYLTLSAPWRRRVEVGLLWVIATATTCFAIYTLQRLWSLREILTEDGGVWLFASSSLMILGCAGFFWWLVWDARKRRSTQ